MQTTISTEGMSELMRTATIAELERQKRGRETGECDYPIFENFLAAQHAENEMTREEVLARYADLGYTMDKGLEVVECKPNEVFITVKRLYSPKAAYAPQLLMTINEIDRMFADVRKLIGITVTHGEIPGNYHVVLKLPWNMSGRNKTFVAMACGSQVSREWAKAAQAQRGEEHYDYFLETNKFPKFDATNRTYREVLEWMALADAKAKQELEVYDRLKFAATKQRGKNAVQVCDEAQV